MFLCNIVVYKIKLYLHHQTHPLLGIVSHLGSLSSFFLTLLVIDLHSSPVAYWTPFNLGAQLLVSSFAFTYCSWCFHGKNTVMICYSFLQWTTFCQNSSLWPVCLLWPYTAWFIQSLSYTSPFTMIRLWSLKVGETTRPFSYDLNHIHYNYTEDVMNRRFPRWC